MPGQKGFIMMEEEGSVVRVESGYAVVRAEKGSGCEGCGSKASCHAMGGADGKMMEIKAINDVNAQVGDRVRVAIDSVVLLKSSFLIYIVPLVFMIAGGIAGDSYARSNMPDSDADLIAGSVGIFSFLISFIFIKMWSKNVEKKAQYRPRIIRILNH